MNKKIKILFSIIIFLAIITLNNNINAGISGTKVIEVGEEVNLSITSPGSLSNITWSSSNTNIVTVTPKYATTYTTSHGVKKETGKEATDVATIKGKKSGSATITVTYTMKNKGANLKKQDSITITVNKTLEEQKEEAEQTVTDMENAYKTVPGKNADATTIDTFIKSDAAYNNFKNLKKVSKEKAEIWKKTVEAARIDAISRDMYTETVDTLNDYINDKNINSHREPLAEKIGVAIEATQTTIENIKEKIKLSIDKGKNRSEVEFIDVLDDVKSYMPSDTINGSDAQKTEEKIADILRVITSIGMLLSVIMPAIIGVKYMLGSIEEKAEYKKDMVPYFVGAVLLFGICTIVKILQSFGQSINDI